MGANPLESSGDTGGRLLVALARIGVVLRSHAWKDAGPRGMTATQAQVLVVLHSHTGTGLRLSEIAARLGVSAPTVSDSVTTLERKGLVAKRAAPDDARALSVVLTESGRSEAAAVSEWPDLLLATADVLDDAEQAVLLRTLMKVIRELQARDQIAPSRMCATCTYFRPYVHAEQERPHHCAFVDAPFGDRSLRLDCPEHEDAGSSVGADNWRVFAAGPPA